MMMARVPSYLSRLAALALTGAVVAGAYLFVLAPAYERFRLAQVGLLEQRQLLGRLKQAEAATTGTPRVGVGDNGRRLFLVGESDAVMAASLQATLQSAGQAAGWRLTSTRVLSARQEGALRLVGIEGRLSTSLAGLQHMLLALEAARPVVVITALQVTPVATITAPPAASGTGEELTVRLEIYGAAGAHDTDRSHGKR